jgi:hypothetical protein
MWADIVESSKIREAPMFCERALNPKSPLLIPMTSISGTTGGQCQILADPSAENTRRPCLVNF